MPQSINSGALQSRRLRIDANSVAAQRALGHAYRRDRLTPVDAGLLRHRLFSMRDFRR